MAERAELDRWVLSELHGTVADVIQRMDEYDSYGACQALNGFVDGLSNWYVRRSRDRFWSEDKQSADKLDAYWTLYECLLTLSKLIAPFTPFLAETMWRNLAGVWGSRARESVHLCDYPTPSAQVMDSTLSAHMRLAREISSLGRSARMGARLKVRQPLAKVEVILASDEHRSWLESHAALIAEELNVKEVDFTTSAEHYISYQVKPNFKVLGPMVGKDMPLIKKVLAEADGGQLLHQLEEDGEITLNLPSGREVKLTDQHIEVSIVAREGWAAAQGKGCVVVLATELTEALLREGLANDLIRAIQDRRKQLQLEYTRPHRSRNRHRQRSVATGHRGTQGPRSAGDPGEVPGIRIVHRARGQPFRGRWRGIHAFCSPHRLLAGQSENVTWRPPALYVRPNEPQVFSQGAFGPSKRNRRNDDNERDTCSKSV